MTMSTVYIEETMYSSYEPELTTVERPRCSKKIKELNEPCYNISNRKEIQSTETKRVKEVDILQQKEPYNNLDRGDISDKRNSSIEEQTKKSFNSISNDSRNNSLEAVIEKSNIEPHNQQLISDLYISSSPFSLDGVCSKPTRSLSTTTSTTPTHKKESIQKTAISGPVEINVGGDIFVVGPQSISRSSFLSSLVRPLEAADDSSGLLRDGSGRVFIDRDANEFRGLIEYLRTRELALTENGQPLAIQLRRFRKTFSFYGVPMPSVCSNCFCLYDSEYNEEDSCLSHPGLQFASTNRQQLYSCCGQTSEALGCRTSAHQAHVIQPNPNSSIGERPVITSQVSDEGFQISSSICPTPKGSIWRIRPEEGSKVPLVVEVGIENKSTGSERIRLENTNVSPTDSHQISRTKFIESNARVSSLLRTKPLVATAISQDEPFISGHIQESSIIEPQEAQRDQESKEDCACSLSSEFASSLDSNQETIPFDLVCRPEDCPRGQNVELVNLVCEVDLESVDFTCNNCSESCPYTTSSEPVRPETLNVGRTSSPVEDSRSHCVIEYDSELSRENLFLSRLQSLPENSDSKLDDDSGLYGSCEESECESQYYLNFRKRVDSEVRLGTAEDGFTSDVEERESFKDDLFKEDTGPCWLYALQKAERQERDEKTESCISNKEKKRCEYFKDRRCTIGGRCQYLHVVDDAEEPLEKATGDEELPQPKKKMPKVMLVGVRNKNTGMNNPRYKTRMCPLFRAGGCPRSSTECKFAHGLEELRGTPEFFKTQICSFWSAGHCRAGFKCRHAHGVNELRPLDFLDQSSPILPKASKRQSMLNDSNDSSLVQSSERPNRPDVKSHQPQKQQQQLFKQSNSPSVPPPPAVTHPPSPYHQTTARSLASSFKNSNPSQPVFPGVASDISNQPSPPVSAVVRGTSRSQNTAQAQQTSHSCRIIWFQVGQPQPPYHQSQPDSQGIYLPSSSNSSWPSPIPQPPPLVRPIGAPISHTPTPSTMSQRHQTLLIRPLQNNQRISSYRSSLEKEANYMASLLTDNTLSNSFPHCEGTDYSSSLISSADSSPASDTNKKIF